MADSKYFGVPFGATGDRVTIPEATQPGGQMSYQQGFGPAYELDPATDPAARRVPRDETNEYLYQITNTIKFIQMYGAPEWYATDDLGASVSYPYNALVRHAYAGANYIWRSIVANNTAEPGTDATKWVLDEALTRAGVQAGSWNYAVASGTPDALIVNLNPAPSQITAGMRIRVKISATNTGAVTGVTLNLNGLGNRPVIKPNGEVPLYGDLMSGSIVDLIDRGNSWQIQNTQAIRPLFQGFNNSGGYLTASEVGRVIQLGTSSGPYDIFLPIGTQAPDGGFIKFFHGGNFPVTIRCQGTDDILPTGTGMAFTSLVINPGETLELQVGKIHYLLTGGTLANRYAADFSNLKSTNGYQKLPNGLIIQWGRSNGSNTGTAPVAFPIAFPSTCFAVTLAPVGVTTQALSAMISGIGNSGFSLAVSLGGAYANSQVHYVATGV